MNSDHIFLLSCRLREAPALARETRELLRQLASTRDYGDWQGSARQARPFEVPDAFRATALAALGLVQAGRLQVRINLLAGGVFVTDGVWVDPAYRAFPFSDESEMLVAEAHARGWAQAADVVYDLAGGCGHAALSFSAQRNVLLDISPRALAYAEVNKLLNERWSPRYPCGLNDIRTGLSAPQAGEAGRGVLLVSNMPFAPAPGRADLPLTSNGGTSGLDLQRSACRAIRGVRQCVPRGVPVRALVMGMTLGDAAAGRWELPALAAQELGESCVAWTLLTGETLLRLDGRRAMANPSRASDALPAIASCTLYNPVPSERAARRDAFAALARQHAARGAPDMAFGIVAVEMN